MIKHLLTTVVLAFILFSACSKKDSINPEEQPGDNTPVTEGTIEMGMYSHGIDLGYFIREIDFSRDDVSDQFIELAENNEEGRQFLALLQQYSQDNPFAALALMMNSVICTYYIKGDIVLGRARGFGYEFDNYHDTGKDEGKLFLRTLVQSDAIPSADRELSLNYIPSADLGVGSGGAIEASMYDRETRSEKAVVAGYSCNVSAYTLKSQYIPQPDPGNPLPQTPICYKLMVYTSEAFDKTINFTHPFYLPENAGILKLEVFYDRGEEPTLVMQPENITSRVLTDGELQIRVKDPIYDYSNTAAAWKMFAILFSGWGALNGEG